MFDGTSSRAELAKVAITFLHRCDLKGVEARRMVEVQEWLATIANEAPAAAADPGNG